MSVPRILYLEDDEDDVFLLRDMLSGAGIEADLIHVSTPWDFAAALKNPPPNLILTDGKVAGFVTRAALDLARASCPQVPLFCLTGLVTEEKIADMRDAGAAGCLSKHDLSAVSETIRQTLAAEETG